MWTSHVWLSIPQYTLFLEFHVYLSQLMELVLSCWQHYHIVFAPNFLLLHWICYTKILCWKCHVSTHCWLILLCWANPCCCSLHRKPLCWCYQEDPELQEVQGVPVGLWRNRLWRDDRRDSNKTARMQWFYTFTHFFSIQSKVSSFYG